MPNTSISNLTAGGAVAGTDLFPDVQTVGVGPVKVTATQLKTFMNASPSITGSITLNGATSGTVTLGVPAVAGTTTFTLPGSNGTSGYVLTTNGSGVTSWTAPSSLTALLTVGTTPTSGGAAGQLMYDTGSVLQESSSLVWDNTNKLLTVTGLGTGGGANTGGLTVSGGPFGLAGNISANAWTTSGIRYRNVAATITDLTSTGTVATAYTDLFGGNTIAASSATTFTNYYTSWFNAPTAGTNVTFTGRWAMGLGGSLDIQAGTVTTNTTPALNLTQTWNAAGVTFTGLKFNATDTASASGSLLLDLQIGGASRLTLSKDGSINQPGGSCRFGGDKVGIQTSVNGISIFNTGSLAWSSTTLQGGTPDLFLTRAAAATLQLGAADAAAPVAQTLQVQSVVAGTSNTAGANFTINGSKGTGTGAGGSIIFQVAPAGSSGTAQNAYSTALTLNSSQQAVIQSAGSASVPSLAWSGDLTTGFFKSTTNIVDLSINGTVGARWSSGGWFFPVSTGRLSLSSGGAVSWSSGTAGSAGEDVYLYRDAANTLALRNGANAQKFRVYNTYTSSTNYEDFEIDWQTTANIALVGPTKGSGGGTQRVQRLQYLEDGGTGSTTPSLGTTCPAASATIKSWIKVITSDGTTAYIPCWA